MRNAGPRLQRHDNRIYYIHWTDPGATGQSGLSRRKSTRLADATKAHAFFAEWLSARNGAPQPEGPVYKIADLWDVYDTKHIQQKVVATDRLKYAWANLKPHFGSLEVTQLSDETVDAYIKKRLPGKLGKRAKPSTVRRELNALIACINWSGGLTKDKWDNKRVTRLIDPATIPYIELPDHGEPRDRWLTTHEIKKLFAAAAGMRRVNKTRLSRCELFLWLALETAARKSAICELTWDRVDFETNVIHYDVPGRKKTKKRRSAPPISKALREVLLRARDEQTEQDALAPANPLVLGNGSDPRRIVERAAKRAGLKGVTPHVLRHTAATHMARRGVPLWKIAKILGNTLAVVERVYAKHCPDYLREAVDTITGGAVEMAV